MFPIRDSVRPERTPVMNWLIMLANVGAFAWMYHVAQTPEDLKVFLERFGVVPERVRALVSHPRLILDAPWPVARDALLPFVSYMFVHGGIAHLVSNLWFLHVFGDNVEGRLGARRYLVFFFVCGILAAALHVASIQFPPGPWTNTSIGEGSSYRSLLEVPVVGASGAIAGVLGAYTVWFPRSRILTFFPPIFFFEISAFAFLGVWFVMQFLMQYLLSSGGMLHGKAVNVAYWVHIGGFVAGAVLALLRPRRVEQ